MRRLVVVADNALIVAAIQIGFRQSDDFKLVGYADPRKTSAHTILRAEPDAILLDDLGQSGRTIELLREIREGDDEIAVLMLSIRFDPDWLDRLLSAGASGVISKATPPTTLITLVRETLNGHIVHRAPVVLPTVERPDAALESADPPLTGREAEILQLVACGSTNGEIARRLWVTEQTVKFHLRNIFRKLDVANRTQASHLAHVRGLVRAAPTLDLAEQHALSAVS
ncbi:MAG: LuxR C-terminal-related transcriptional regulator [Solirubrobacteraceae bacterium]